MNEDILKFIWVVGTERRGESARGRTFSALCTFYILVEVNINNLRRKSHQWQCDGTENTRWQRYDKTSVITCVGSTGDHIFRHGGYLWDRHICIDQDWNVYQDWKGVPYFILQIRIYIMFSLGNFSISCKMCQSLILSKYWNVEGIVITHDA